MKTQRIALSNKTELTIFMVSLYNTLVFHVRTPLHTNDSMYLRALSRFGETLYLTFNKIRSDDWYDIKIFEDINEAKNFIQSNSNKQIYEININEELNHFE